MSSKFQRNLNTEKKKKTFDILKSKIYSCYKDE